VLAVVALLAAASIVIGATSVILLRATLVDRLDEQLRAATLRSQGPGAPDDGPPRLPGPNADIPRELVTVGTVTAIVLADTYYAGAFYDDEGSPRPLDADQQEIIAGLLDDGRPQSATLGGLGDYRFVSVEGPSDVVRVIGLPLSPVNSIVGQLLVAVGIVTLLGVALAGVAGTVVVRRSLRPLDRVAATAGRVAELQLDRGEVALAERVADVDADPRTEVGQVGAAINRMLGHVASALSARQESERKVRQFVADASHELRTPLASIRGYSELTRRTGHDLPADVVHSIGRVESEAVRMTSLVEDLLLLARLDEGRDLESEPVDLSRLLIDAVSDAHAAGPHHEWSLDLPEEPMVILGDRLRLHQVVANVLTNARVHTPAGTTVAVVLRGAAGEAGADVAARGDLAAGVDVAARGDLAVGGDLAVLTIADTGPGIPSELQPHLFERFARGDSSRSRVAGSTGLGLAIVQAVVAGHGGAVTVRSGPGETVFTVLLPVAGPRSPA
jgi:two-component system OmpR family sensor kinase